MDSFSTSWTSNPVSAFFLFYLILDNIKNILNCLPLSFRWSARQQWMSSHFTDSIRTQLAQDVCQWDTTPGLWRLPSVITVQEQSYRATEPRKIGKFLLYFCIIQRLSAFLFLADFLFLLVLKFEPLLFFRPHWTLLTQFFIAFTHFSQCFPLFYLF